MDESQNNSQNKYEEEVKKEYSKVSTAQAKNIAVLTLIVIVFMIIFYNMFLKDYFGESKKIESPHLDKAQVIKPNLPLPTSLPEIPKLPEPKLVEPSLPPPLPAPSAPQAPPIPPIPNLPNTLASTAPNIMSAEAASRRETKRKSSIMLKNSISTPKSDNSQIVKIQSLEYTLGRGKFIDAVLETPVDTEIGGEIRAIISRDVFSESGNIILIPKGSRVFGKYSTGANSIYGRVDIAWDRVDLVSGYRLKLDGLGVDNLGKKGIEGRLDNKYTEQMANAVLVSAFNILVAQGVDKLVRPVVNNQAVAANQAISSNITSVVNPLIADSTKTYADICTAIRNAFSDKSLTAYTTADASCNALASSTANDNDKKSTAATIASTASSSVLATTATTTTPTKAQDAATEGYNNVTQTLKDILSKQTFNPNITIDQGKPIRIYVTQDYIFPKEAITKFRLVR